MSKALLLDTHIFLWMRTAPAKLTQAERTAIDAAPRRTVSVVSLWEIALLANLGRIEHDARLFSPPPGVELLGLLPNHCLEFIGLPQIHRDPFDRMLIAQARAENMIMITRDEKIISYGSAGAEVAFTTPPDRN
jgi:PIN domain nuclease of toxin-antitoxin system